MSAPTTTPAARTRQRSFRRFSVHEYHRMIETGILTEEDKVELLEGYVELKMPRNAPHDSTVQAAMKRIFRLLPGGWDLRVQSAITLAESEPEPDISVVRGDETKYRVRHPGPADIGMLVEAADSSLDRDRDDKGRIYAQASIPVYWIINLLERQVETFTNPSGPTSTPAYANRQVFKPGDAVPVVLDGVTVGSIAVAELLP